MATVLEEIGSNLIALGFDNPSEEAIYNKIAQGVAIPIENTIQEIANSEQRILNTITMQRYGKSGYYTGHALAFQYGDDLVIDPVTFEDVYAEIDPSKQIIAQAAFEELSALLFLKVAKVNGLTGDLEPLTLAEKAAFDAYMVNFEIPGLPISKISAPANVLNMRGTITYYATYDLPTLKTNVANAMTAFRKSFKFNGEFFTGDLQDYVKAQVPGVRDAYYYNTTIDGSPFGGFQSLSSGYFNYVPTILDQITYAVI